MTNNDTPKLPPMQQQVIDILSDGNWHGHRELALKVSHNVRDVIRALKKKGWEIEAGDEVVPDVRRPGKTKKARKWRLSI